MRGLWDNKFLFWNFVVLVLIKSFASPLLQLASITEGVALFSAQEIIAVSNEYRASQGVAALKENSILNVVAAQKLDDMVRNQYFAHVSPSGVTPWHWFQVNGYSYSHAGENLATGYPNAQATVDAWVRSPSHRRNLISADFREIGVATTVATIQGDQGVVVVQLFGAPKAAVKGESQSGVDLGLSQSEAREEPIPPARSDSEAVHQVETPREARSTSMQVSQAPGIVQILNQGFMVYAFLLSLMALGYLWVREFKKVLLLKTALHLLIFWLSVALPILAVAQSARIH
jgi:uncharacterized protein YkwD